MIPRGIRNHNPLNIRHSKSEWVGKRKVQTDKVFVQFTHRVYGYRAAFVLLRNYIARGKDTIGKIVAKWAPPSDGNDTDSYIGFVSRSTGIDENHVLQFQDKNAMVGIVASMAQMESGIIEDKELLEKAYEIC